MEILFQLEEPLSYTLKDQTMHEDINGYFGPNCIAGNEEFLALTNQVSLNPFEVCSELPA